jgi:hypothetical protein
VVSPLPDSHSALHINLTHLRLIKRFGHLQEDHIKQWRIGESALLPLFSSRSALPYRRPDSGGVFDPNAWRHGPCSDGWLQPQITAKTLTLSIVSGYTFRQSELFVQSRFHMLLVKL